MEEVAKRIKELIETLSVSNKEFADSIGVAPAIISHVLSGRNNPSLNLIQQITNVYTNVNLNYLLNGTGSLIGNNVDDKTTKTSNKELEVNPAISHLPPGARYVPPPSGTPRQSADFKAEVESHTNRPVKEVKEPIDRSDDEELTNSYTNVNPSNSKKVERVIIFYTDHSFREYRPEG